MARVIDIAFADAPTLGALWTREVFVTGAEDISAITSSEELALRLTLVDESNTLRSGPFVVIEFDAPATGVASPVRRANPGFTGRGRTAGGAREFAIPNQQVADLENVVVRIVP